MLETDDWRLTGQEGSLRGETLYRRRWTAPSPQWDHEHCAFCWAKFSGCNGTLREGYVTRDGRHWICPQCFSDFKTLFAWNVAGSAISQEKG